MSQIFGTSAHERELGACKARLSQARELQRKIQSRRPDTPAPAEPTKSAARRLNISRDNVELRRMMEESTKKRAEP